MCEDVDVDVVNGGPAEAFAPSIFVCGAGACLVLCVVCALARLTLTFLTLAISISPSITFNPDIS